MRQRNRAHKKAKQKNITDYWKKYRDIRNEVISLVCEVKNKYLSKLQNILVDKTIAPGKWWRVAKSICQFKNRTTRSSPINVNTGNNIMTHPFDKSNASNEYFTSISTLDNEPELHDLPPLSPCELFDIVITEQDVVDQFSNLKNK
jgi:hypothetical protein